MTVCSTIRLGYQQRKYQSCTLVAFCEGESTSGVPSPKASNGEITSMQWNHESWWSIEAETMGLLPNTKNCGLHMRQDCRERFPRHRLQRKPPVSDSGMHHGTCITHVPWCMSGSLIRSGGENVPGHSRRMCNLRFYVSGKRPIASLKDHPKNFAFSFCLMLVCYYMY